MKIDPLSQAQYDQMRANSIDQGNGNDVDRVPVVKLFTPDAQCTWLLTEIDEDGRCFGLCDLGHGEPELGYVMLEEIQDLKGGLGLKVEVDQYVSLHHTLSFYYDAARKAQRIVT
jgi:hypothetical protein